MENHKIQPNKDRDEYPFAMTKEGGKNLNVKHNYKRIDRGKVGYELRFKRAKSNR